jgi:hypothetical protein
VAFTATTHGSDKDGLVCAYLFAPGSFLWLHFNVSNAAAERFMQPAPRA